MNQEARISWFYFSNGDIEVWDIHVIYLHFATCELEKSIKSENFVYRKGVDLVVEVVPAICRKRFGDVKANFLIAGDGPKRILLEEMKSIQQRHRCF